MMHERNEIERRTSAGLWARANAAVWAALAAGLLLRLWWVWRFGQITTDTRVYGDFARNLLQHGVYGYTNIVKGVVRAPQPTLIRLPGYPLFLALCFKLFGMENYTAVMLVQTVADLWTCLLLGGVAARIFGRRAGLGALWMAALCPFMANYVAVPLTETLTLLCMGLAFYGVARWGEKRGSGWVLVIGSALAYAVLLRPEQGMLAVAVVPAMLWMQRMRARRDVALVCVLTVLPLVPWTARNWRVFHVFEPLAPRYATDPGDRINYGFQRWYRTWAVEFASTELVYWNYDGFSIDVATLPDRAFDSNAQYSETATLLNDYNQTDNATREIDTRFDALARERISAAPLRYYVMLPMARVLDMMFRPRVELFPAPLEWWKDRTHRGWDAFALTYALLNAGFFALAAVTLWQRAWWREERPLVAMMVATIVMRTLLLLTLDNSEDRYTLEFFPVLVVLGSAVVGRSWLGRGRRKREAAGF
jgi:4-amino-4-deoxy-L-arabinose transferase-like glycosyltransferase